MHTPRSRNSLRTGGSIQHAARTLSLLGAVCASVLMALAALELPMGDARLTVPRAAALQLERQRGR